MSHCEVEYNIGSVEFIVEGVSVAKAPVSALSGTNLVAMKIIARAAFQAGERNRTQEIQRLLGIK